MLRRSPFPSASLLILILFALGLAAPGPSWAAPEADDSAPGTAPDSADQARGFEHPINIIPQIGLWVDGVVELGFTKKTGLILWWSLEKNRAPGDSSGAAGAAPDSSRLGREASRIDWSRVTFRIRADVYNTKGKRVEREEALIDPLQVGPEGEDGGFPAPLRVPLRAGDYRVHLEAYPLISASAAGLDSVPRGTAESTAHVIEISHRVLGWNISDPLFLDSVRRWEPGSPDERTWYDWVVRPNPSRTLSAQSKTGQLAFEVVRSYETVPRCGANTCRVVVTVNDAQGGIVLQELRPVPEPATASAYLVPLDASGLAPGRYSVTIEVFEAMQRQASIRREFSISS